jgi:hypothetical protein
VPCIILTGSAKKLRGLFDRYKVYEICTKGRGEEKSFNRAEFLDLVKSAIKEV